jgi:tetratricopeptide (TPR) repeat protein
LTGLEPDLPIKYDYLAGQFEGNTSQTVVFYYSPPGCLRLLDPEIDPYNRLIPDDSLLREAAKLSTTAPVLSETVARMPAVFDPEPNRGWCYYFEQADLARQMGEWEEVANLGDKAFNLDDYPNDPLERFVFVEGYAHVGEWEKALEYAQVSYKVSKNYVGPLLCRLWERIDRDVPGSPEKYDSVLQAKTLFVCNP